MPIPPTAWDAWYGQDAHTSYCVGCVVWQGALPPTVWVRGMGRMPIPPIIVNTISNKIYGKEKDGAQSL